MRVWKGKVDEYKEVAGAGGAGSEQEGTCGPFAVFGIVSCLCPDVQLMAQQSSSQKRNECTHTFGEERDSVPWEQREKKSDTVSGKDVFGANMEDNFSSHLENMKSEKDF